MTRQKIDLFKLSKEISYALRHAPWEYELELDEEGWVSLEQLLLALRLDQRWEAVHEQDIHTIMATADKQRLEVADGKIRALYGHSVPSKIIKKAETPPSVVYHGTARRFVAQILDEGLRPMGRQYVHVSADKETAMLVGKRRDAAPVLLKVDAETARNEGIMFYPGNHTIWLADFIPPKYISIE
ncbi:RNA 2'-phosphotransferase [Paenibacillus thiaminolyticus]|uniref:RNA 2'-phosphotransferase n=1 Tax=Paenibacillus thiaminolyticus TaxID=49283 RepID=UPI0023301E6E|nr:RNA 2'-phosphotransferase [Paenibacillus thiaminolyticus]WCF08896.1 RNA 2'-phosphotransferase [Paenibacillus thiaminolyticus]